MVNNSCSKRPSPQVDSFLYEHFDLHSEFSKGLDSHSQFLHCGHRPGCGFLHCALWSPYSNAKNILSYIIIREYQRIRSSRSYTGQRLTNLCCAKADGKGVPRDCRLNASLRCHLKCLIVLQSAGLSCSYLVLAMLASRWLGPWKSRVE